MILPRLPDWDLRLVRALEATPPFAWGTHDCCRFAARVVAAMTGHDPMAAAYAGRYQSADDAATLMASGGGLGALLAGTLGAPLPSLASARRGDVVLAAIGDHETVGILADARIAAQGPDGVVFLPRRCGRLAWSIG